MKKRPPKRRVIEALLGEYRIVVRDLDRHLRDLSEAELQAVVDRVTRNPECVSIQSILTHVVFCGRKYLTLIDRHRANPKSAWPRRVSHSTVADSRAALERMMVDSETFFTDFDDTEMARYLPEEKLKAPWGQLFDYEQLLEHAIVHVSRHRRQIQAFKAALRKRARPG